MITGVLVRRYRNENALRRDANKLSKSGWTIKSTEFVAKRRGCLGALTYWLFFGWLFAILFQQKNGYFVVTYERS